ncbi:MAG: hypothetical protein IPJ76_06120 [Flavobacteriales bacterium]|nr:MAG: hypothetical protein IPJ76_06120 [Flavobacteriales bacterium]
MPAASFQRFASHEEALALMDQFREAGIPSTMRANAAVMGGMILGQAPTEHHVLIDSSDFPRAHALLDAEARSMLTSVGTDHPLHSFTNEELMEVLARPHEWTALDVRLAQHLLTERGLPISEGVIDDLYARSIARMSEHDRAGTSLIVIGSIILIALPSLAYSRSLIPMLTISLMLMSLLWYIARSRKTIADGSVMMRYNGRDRIAAMLMMVVCAVSLLIALWRIAMQ